MIDLTVTASDDVESSANVETRVELSTIKLVNSLPFLFLFVILQFSSRALSNRSVAKCYG